MFLHWIFRIGGIALLSALSLAVLLGLLTGWNIAEENSDSIEYLGRAADMLLITGVIGGVVLLPNAIKQVWRMRESRSVGTTAILLVLVICFFGFAGYFLYTRVEGRAEK